MRLQGCSSAGAGADVLNFLQIAYKSADFVTATTNHEIDNHFVKLKHYVGASAK